MSAINDATELLRDTDEEDAPTTVLSELFESLESSDDIATFDDSPSSSAFIARPEFELGDFMPEGPYTLRIMGRVYENVYDDLMLKLLRRGLLAGAEVWRAPRWIPFAEHPDFGAIQAQMAEEVERVVGRTQPPRELTPQPHWSTPQNVRGSQEVTQPSIRLVDVEGMSFDSEGLDAHTDGELAHHSEPFDDTRKTAEFDSEPFRKFAKNCESAETSRIDPSGAPAAVAEVSADRARERSNPFRKADTEVSEILTLEERSEDAIETREGESRLLPSERPTRERPHPKGVIIGGVSDVRPRQPSPLEGSASPRTAFPTSVETDEPGTQEPVPGAAILHRPSSMKSGRKPPSLPQPNVPKSDLPSPPGKAAPREPESASKPNAAADRSMQVPSRKKQPTASLPIVRSEPEAAPDLPSRLPTWVVYLATAAAAISVVALAIVGVRYWAAQSEETRGSQPTAAEVAIEVGSNRVDHALPRALTDGEDVAALAATLSSEPASERLWILRSLHASRPSAATAIEAARASVELEEWDDARALLRDAVALGAPMEQIRPLFSEVLNANASLAKRPAVKWQAIDSLERDEERLVLRRGDERWVFVPSTRSDAGAHRPLMNMSRLCEIVTCAFEVPQTVRVTLPRALVEEAASDDVEIDEFRWVATPDGDVVDGATFRIDDTLEPFPIDDEPRWRAWLEARELTAEERADIATLVGPGQTESVLRSLSSLMVVDFVTNNWSRIDDGHTTTLIDGGQLVSVRHDAAFATRSSKRVAGRFSWVGRFDRTLISELRIVTPELVDPFLFVEGDPTSQARRDEFWSQREELLEIVEDAERRHGDAIWL